MRVFQGALIFFPALVLALGLTGSVAGRAEAAGKPYDVVVYGGTSAGVAAAGGKPVALIALPRPTARKHPRAQEHATIVRDSSRNHSPIEGDVTRVGSTAGGVIVSGRTASTTW